MALDAKGFLSDELTCAREPIHVPGKIQPHGYFLAFREERVTHASENFRVNDADPLGRSLREILGEKAHAAVTKVFSSVGEIRPRRVGEWQVDGRAVDLVAHRCASGFGVLEMELQEAARSTGHALDFSSVYQGVDSALERIERARHLEELWQATTEECRRLSGYDRVMVYQFDAEWNGTVVGESTAEGIEPFLGLRYPASDIPAQARALYERNWIRAIPDVAYQPVGIRGQDPYSLDMSLSVLRSVSPVHLQYLKNMRVGASMSVSILRDGKLWGLIAFHHSREKFLSFELRQGLEFLGKFLSLQIGVKEKAGPGELRAELSARRASLESGLRSSADFVADMAQHKDLFLGMVSGSVGGAILRPGAARRIGEAPAEADLQRLYEWLREAAGRREVFATQKLSTLLPWASSIARGASGLLAISIPEPETAYVVWFKPEVEQTVRWAGKPEKLPGGPGGLPLGPRKSFELWREQVRESSLPWHPEELEELELLRRTLIEVDLERQVQAVLRSNQELDEFAAAVAHDLKEPLRGIQAFAGFLREDNAATLPAASRENLDHILQLSRRAGSLISDLFEYSRLGRIDLAMEVVNLRELVREVAQSLELSIREKGARVEISEDLPRLRCDRVRTGEIFYNLIANALRYNESEAPLVRVSARNLGGNPVLCVSDNGIGIRAEDHERVFRLFERLHSGGRFPAGSGMGLAIVRRAVGRHHGRIWIESEGQGTTFCFTLAPDSAEGKEA